MSDNRSSAARIAGADKTPEQWAPLTLGFRPFFLLSICFAVLLMLASLAFFATGFGGTVYFTPSLWHGHEMVFGYATAVIAGFLLTAVRNWTGLPTPSGRPLALLVLLWLAPRLLSVVPLLPATAFALLDILFLPVLAVVLGRVILQVKQAHNYPVPLLVLLLGLCNAGVHLDMLGFAEGLAGQSMQVAVITMLALVVVVAGRVVPFFMQGAIGRRPVSYQWIERMALPSVLLLAVAVLIANPWLTMVSALLAALIHSIRLIGWFDRAIFRQPMLWVLHAGYLWLIAGFLIYAVAVFIDMAMMQAIHAWTVGAIGMFTLGMMARVALGHTGRPIEPLPGVVAAFVLLFVAAFARVVLPLISVQLLNAALMISAVSWIAAFLIIAMRYVFILLRPRADGKPG
ncbi:MAG: hypothetical protein COW18_08995 [Zetaproteobacteria bacterium CG12_big_fil_rev_8_21_14_0_65_54_13]|nr:MAG: hypothetical protein COX55_07915 [Zetaproteobacteria bacterium CG23_combo_of_CG06-09_8_20_14_all_54_7]PIW47355.1 MAG: hypothetical protein COW18_08995 [Zetaproteobacteria bacterium CG12_big_fil_rev_8_21_14_0_65_54_13]PIX55130.1 MAG: hypothetical protein COZ50_04195 [Zetaproteobacteria bacterium CG_4_10_14_3_um_filter_54_28]PJA30004.1 MAG: hypothetical protein CO188_04975 [Zetaproteobacteria bacterium CG_4_9_14_3_um_filter_54_145]